MYQVTDPVTTADEIRDTLGPQMASQVNKVIDHIDVHCRVWMQRAPFILVASADGAGDMDISPKGDPAGFVKVLDDHTFAIPERIGNNRGDTFYNLIENPAIAVMFVVPGRKEVLRVNGTAVVAKDPLLLDQMQVNSHRPDLATVVRVKEAFFHCGKSIVRSSLWHSDKWPSLEGLPSYAQALKDHGDMQIDLEDLADELAVNAVKRLY
jgi:PPOX class probable FMN-dependent enzyme